MIRLGRLGAAALLCALLTGCGTTGLSFVRDDRVTITAPVDRAEVELPVTIRWEVEDFELSGRTGQVKKDAGYFGVLLDRSPPPPGEELGWLIRDDPVCKEDPACPNDDYLARRDIFSTTDTSIVIREVPEPAVGERSRQFHEVTVILLDGAGRRVGESAFSVEFEVPRAEEDR